MINGVDNYGWDVYMTQSPCRSVAHEATWRLTLRLTAVVFLLAGVLSRSWGANNDREILVGTWRLVTFLDTPEVGAPVQAFGSNPIGYFVFTADGHASISIMRNPPNTTLATKDPDPDVSIPDWYTSYFGTYTVDRKHGLYIVHVLGSNVPTYVGTDQVRHFSISGDKLVISETYTAGTQHVKAERVLVRDVPQS